MPYGAVRCRAAPCGAVRCVPYRAVQCAVLCSALPCCVLSCTYSFVHANIFRSIIPRTGTTTPGLYILRCWIANNAPQLISAQLYIAQQRNAVRCHAVPCLALRCGAVSCCAVLSFEHTPVPGIIQVPGTGMYVLCTRLFAFFS